jgi:nitroreductase
MTTPDTTVVPGTGLSTLDVILTRRSIRAFTAQPVDPQRVEQILQAAMSAPSACNQQPWHFVVVTDRKTLDAIPTIHPYAAMCTQAALAILVCADPLIQTCPGFWPQDCAAATENLLLAAHALGLGAVWTGVYPGDERIAHFREFFSLPKHIVPFCLVPIGYPAEPAHRADRYKAERVHRNRW